MGANSIRLHRDSGKVFYQNLVYPEFETDPHSALLRSIKLSLRTRELDCYDYASARTGRSSIAKKRFCQPTTRSMPGSLG